MGERRLAKVEARIRVSNELSAQLGSWSVEEDSDVEA